MNSETKERFVQNLGECLKWLGIAIMSVVVPFAIFMLMVILGGSPLPEEMTIAEEFPYFLIGVGRVFVYVVIPLLACAGFKTWVLKR